MNTRLSFFENILSRLFCFLLVGFWPRRVSFVEAQYESNCIDNCTRNLCKALSRLIGSARNILFVELRCHTRLRDGIHRPISQHGDIVSCVLKYYFKLQGWRNITFIYSLYNYNYAPNLYKSLQYRPGLHLHSCHHTMFRFVSSLS